MPKRKFAPLLLSLLISAPLCPAQSHDAAQGSSQNSVWYNARRGSGSAMNQLGIWYYSGKNVPQDYGQAAYWWGRGAVAQNAKAIANLGICYQYGRGVEADSLTAVQLYVTAIQNGQLELLEQRRKNTPHNVFDDMLVGFCYEKGIGTLRDVAQAAGCYAQAADRGSVEGMVRAADMMLEQDRPMDALRYYESASAAGDTYATYMVGRMRLGRMGVAADKPKAVNCLAKAAQASLPEAMGEYGNLYLTGEAMGRDLTQALSWLRRAAQAGYAPAMWTYAQALREDRDYDEALRWMTLAADAGYADQYVDLVRHLPADDPYGYYIKGADLYSKGQYDSAMECFALAGKGKATDARVMEAVALSHTDASKGAKQLEKLASANALAAYHLAQLYMGGHGLPADTGKAIKYYRQAAKAGYGPAQDVLATIYYDGRLIAADRKEAKRLYLAAREQHTLSEHGARNLSNL